MTVNIEDEARKLTALLVDEIVRNVRRNNAEEVLIEFASGGRLFVNATAEGLEFSVTSSRRMG